MGQLQDNIDTLREWRDNNERKSREVLQIWLETVWPKIDSLGNERFLILEQVCIAALDCYNLSIAKQCIEKLFEEFPQSLRVKKLEVMLLETDEQYDVALDRLNKLISTDESNSALKKRRIAILKAQGKYPEAIKELTDYLKIFMADVEAWQELSELYIAENEFNKAAFCVEELILHNPHNHLLHQRYAEIKYTLGGYDNIETAKAYYAQALKLNPDNMRALYGLYLTATALSASQKNPAQKKKEANKMAESVLKEIKNKYAKADVIVSALAALEL